MIANITVAEKRFLLIFTALLAVILSLPWLYGMYICPADKYYTGFLGLGGSDSAFYLGWGAAQAADGSFLFEDKYNGFAYRRAVFNPLWLCMGWFAKLFGLSIPVVFNIQRVLSSLFLVWVVYKILPDFFSHPTHRVMALLLVVFSSGTKLISAESNNFYNMMFEVNLPMATALFYIAVHAAYKTLYLKPKHGHIAGLLTLLLGTVYPYAVISVWIIFFAVTAWLCYAQAQNRRQHIIAYLKIVLWSSPIVLHDGYLVLTDPRLTVGQASFSTPNFIWYMTMGVGLLFFLAVLGTYFVVKRKYRLHYFIVIWAAVTLAQMYIPLSLIPFQVQLIVGVQLPLAILAVYALFQMKKYAVKRWQKLQNIGQAGQMAILALLLIVASPFSVRYYFQTFKKVQNLDIPEYLDLSAKKGMDWLKHNTHQEEQVLAMPLISPFIPVETANRMYSADYWAPTADYFTKAKQIFWLFDQDSIKTDMEIRHFLDSTKMDYLFYERLAAEKGGSVTPARLLQLPELEKVYEQEGVVIIKYGKK